mgnify:CR=1 FL=1
MDTPDKAAEIKAAAAALIAFGTALFGWVGWMVVLWLAAMALDYLTGTFAALYNKTWSSAAARRGLWHKLGSIFGVKKRQVQSPRMIGNRDLRDIQRTVAGLRNAVRQRIAHDRSHKAGGNIRLQRRDRQKLRPILIVARVKMQQIVRRFDTEPREQLRLFRPDPRQNAYRLHFGTSRSHFILLL